MDTGSWQGTVHSIAKSRTRLRQLSPHEGKSEASGIQKLKENLNPHTHTHTDFPCQKAWCFVWGGEGRDLQWEAVIIILLPMIDVLFRNPGVRNSLYFLHGLSTWNWAHTASSCSRRVSGEGRRARKQGQRQHGRAKPWFNILEWYLPLWAQREPYTPSRGRGLNLHCFAHLENKYVILRKVCQVNHFLNVFVLLLFSCSVVSDSLRPHGLQHARLPCPSLSPRVCSNSCPLSRWCHPTISSSGVPFSSYLLSSPASGSFLMSRLFTSGGQSIGASASVFPMNIQGWFPNSFYWSIIAL